MWLFECFRGGIVLDLWSESLTEKMRIICTICTDLVTEDFAAAPCILLTVYEVHMVLFCCYLCMCLRSRPILDTGRLLPPNITALV